MTANTSPTARSSSGGKTGSIANVWMASPQAAARLLVDGLAGGSFKSQRKKKKPAAAATTNPATYSAQVLGHDTFSGDGAGGFSPKPLSTIPITFAAQLARRKAVKC